MLTAIASAPLPAAASAFEGSVSPLSLHWAQTLVVIDSAVDDAVSLATAVQQGTVVILQEGDGIADITAALHPGVRQLMLVAHGEPGVLHLGGVAVTAESLESQRQGLQGWNVDEIVLCSCRVGVDSALVRTLAQLTGSRVVATDEVLGAGNWLPQMEKVFEATMLQRHSGTLNVSSVTSTTTDATYGIGSPINVTVNFSEALDLVGGNLILTLDSGATLTIAPFSGQTSAVATYTVGSGQASADLNVTTISLASGATLQNSGGTNATLTIPAGFALKDSKALVIDGIAPVPSGSYNGFSAQSTFATGSGGYSMTVGDFNGDGKADLAIVNRTSNTVSVLLGTGSGGFSARSTFATGNDPRFVTTGDFNGDGKADLAIANVNASNVSVLLGTGSGGFSAQSTFATGLSPRSVTVGDFNGDGKADMVIANSSSYSVSVLLGTGSGGFSAQSTFTIGSNPISVTVGDFNGDSQADLATANLGSNNVSVRLGNGSGGFSAQSTFATGNTPFSLTVGDFNGDSQADMATANINSGTVSVLLNNSLPALPLPANGTYAAGQPLTFTVNFSEAVLVTGIPVLPLTLGSTLVNATYQSGSGTSTLTFTYTIAPGNVDTDGITLDTALSLSGGTLRDAAGNDAVLTLPIVNNSGILVDTVAPSISLSSTAPADVNGLFSVTATFSEPVTSFISSDITATNGTISNFSGTGSTYTFDVTPTSGGAVDVNVAANVAQDAATNGNTVATVLTRNADLIAPTVALSSTAAVDVNGLFSVTAIFSEPVTSFISSDITATNGTISNFSGSGSIYTFDVTPTASGAIDVNVAANVAQDAATNGNTVATVLTRTADLIAPTLTTLTTTTTDGTYGVGKAIDITVNFSENVTLANGNLILTLSSGATLNLTNLSGTNHCHWHL